VNYSNDSFGGFLPKDWLLDEFKQSQLDSMNDKLNKILWKLQEIQNQAQSGKVPVWFVKENPNWVHYNYVFKDNK
jgi:hypothetical protein